MLTFTTFFLLLFAPVFNHHKVALKKPTCCCECDCGCKQGLPCTCYKKK